MKPFLVPEEDACNLTVDHVIPSSDVTQWLSCIVGDKTPGIKGFILLFFFFFITFSFTPKHTVNDLKWVELPFNGISSNVVSDNDDIRYLGNNIIKIVTICSSDLLKHLTRAIKRSSVSILHIEEY